MPVPWFPQANGPLMARRPVAAIRRRNPSVRKPASDLGPSWFERVTGIEPALSAWELDCHDRSHLERAGHKAL